MRFLTPLPTALAAVVASFIVIATAQTPPGFHCDTDTPLRLANEAGWGYRTGAQYRTSELGHQPAIFFDRAQPNQTYTAIILDLPIIIASTHPLSIITTSDKAYLSFVQTSLQPVPGNSKPLTSNIGPIVPFGTYETTSTEPRAIVALLFENHWNSTLPSELQNQLRETGDCEEKRAEFDLVEFFSDANLGNPVAATWFIIIQDACDCGDDTTTARPTTTRTVTTSVTKCRSTRTVTASVTKPCTTTGVSQDSADGGSKATGNFLNGTAPSTTSTTTSEATAVESSDHETSQTLASAGSATTEEGTGTVTEDLSGGTLTTLTFKPTVAWPLGTGTAANLGTSLRPSSTATSAPGLDVTAGTAGAVRDTKPALVGVIAALMTTAGFYWVFL